MKVEARRCKYKKITAKYDTDNVLDIIDIEDTLSKNKFIPKAEKDNFIFLTEHKDAQSTHLSFDNNKEINVSKLNKNKFKINFNNLQLEYSTGYSIPFIKDYFPIDIIGEGSFGLVVSAFKRGTKEKIAVKIIDKNNLDQNFYLKEVEIVNKLDNPRILKIYEVLDTSQYFFIFMELIEGGSLKDLIIKRYYDNSNDYLFRDSECAMIMNGVLEAIDYLHKNRIIHRDIKPENIMFKSKDNLNSVILCDFGMAYQLTNMEKFTQERCGTLIYMAPEVIENRKYDHLIDSFSAGIVLYILVSGGRHPIYKNGMTTKEYEEKLLKKEKFTFVPSMPLLARNLFLKLCKYQAFFRYETYKALKHPWITRMSTSQIPLTLIDELEREDKIKSFKSLLSSSLFFEMFKNYYHLSRKRKEPEKVNENEKTSHLFGDSHYTHTSSSIFKEMNIYFVKREKKRSLSKIATIPKLKMSSKMLNTRCITNLNSKNSYDNLSIYTTNVSMSQKKTNIMNTKRIYVKATNRKSRNDLYKTTASNKMLHPLQGKKIYLKTGISLFHKNNNK